MADVSRPTTRLLIEYEGTDFAGWARQPGQRTVQGELERALGVVLRRDDVALSVAGRTDAGVHASAQVASHQGDPASPEGLNALLPFDIAVVESAAASPGFDARHHATSRAYAYRILTRRSRSPFERRRALHWPQAIHIDSLHGCAALLTGTHDFTAFTPTVTDHVHFRRRVMSAAWTQPGPGLLEFRIEADAFMRNMIRVLVGTMLEVAGAGPGIDRFARLLDGSPRSEAGRTAPPHGLCLLGVGYAGERILLDECSTGEKPH